MKIQKAWEAQDLLADTEFISDGGVPAVHTQFK